MGSIHHLLSLTGVLLFFGASAWAGHYPAAISPGNVPWPGGVVPYEFDAALSPAQQQAYLDGLREFELAGNVQFVPRTTEVDWVLYKYHPAGPNLVSGSQPQVVEINLLTRGQICHEMGHSFGLLHEHQRPDRDTFVEILSGNIIPGNAGLFDIIPGETSFGAFDFESVMHYGRDVLSVSPGVLDTIRPRPGFEKYTSRLGNLALSPADRAMMAFLYGPPSVPLSPVVTTTADGGPGSLRAAIYYATDHPGTTITFAIPESDPGFAGGVFTVKLSGFLPPLVTPGTVIDGTSQPGFAGQPLVFIDGSEILPEAGAVPGLLFYESGCAVRGLGVQRMPWVGIAMLYPAASENTVAACWCGVESDGVTAAPNATQGILVGEGAHANTIGGAEAGEGNLLSGNTQYGLWIAGPAAGGNQVLGNRIGTSADGTAALPNAFGGVILTDGTSGNVIGGTGAARNLISGNTDAGVWITGAGVDDNVVTGNWIGLDAAGTSALPNTFAGIYVINGASDNLIDRNVISGNTNEGVRIAGPGTTGNRVRRNLVGLDALGSLAVPQGFAGLTIFDGASGNTIGGGPGLGNVASGNGSYGIVVGDAASSGNIVSGNLVGLDPPGLSAIGNGFAGIALWGGATANEVGGGSPGSANLVSGNGTYGIVLFDSGTAGNPLPRNAVHGNGFANIFLSTGTNGDQAPPVLSTAALTSSLTVSGSLTSGPGASFTVEFFASGTAFPSAAQKFLGAVPVVTDGTGVAAFAAPLPPAAPAGDFVTATATSAAGDTSALSNAVAVTSNDLDHDGLPDEYEAATPGLSSGIAADALLDNDVDGFSNLAEFRVGTNPNDPVSRSSVAAGVPGAFFHLNIATAAGAVYAIERAVSPAGPWLPAARNIEGTGGTVVVGLPRDDPAGFFRVRF